MSASETKPVRRWQVWAVGYALAVMLWEGLDKPTNWQMAGFLMLAAGFGISLGGELADWMWPRIERWLDRREKWRQLAARTQASDGD
jgi:hypothetical protein